MSILSVTGTFAATGNGSTFMPDVAQNIFQTTPFNAAIYGTFVATVVLEKSFDAGANWVPVMHPATGTAISYTAPSAAVFYEPEDGVLFRFRCSAYTSGTVNYRLSK